MSYKDIYIYLKPFLVSATLHMIVNIPFGTTGMTVDDQLFLLLISSKLFSAHKHK